MPGRGRSSQRIGSILVRWHLELRRGCRAGAGGAQNLRLATVISTRIPSPESCEKSVLPSAKLRAKKQSHQRYVLSGLQKAGRSRQAAKVFAKRRAWRWQAQDRPHRFSRESWHPYGWHVFLQELVAARQGLCFLQEARGTGTVSPAKKHKPSDSVESLKQFCRRVCALNRGPCFLQETSNRGTKAPAVCRVK